MPASLSGSARLLCRRWCKRRRHARRRRTAPRRRARRAVARVAPAHPPSLSSTADSSRSRSCIAAVVAHHEGRPLAPSPRCESWRAARSSTSSWPRAAARCARTALLGDDRDRRVVEPVQTGLEQQRHLDHRRPRRGLLPRAPARARRPPARPPAATRRSRATRGPRSVANALPRERGAIDDAVRRHLGAEARDDLLRAAARLRRARARPRRSRSPPRPAVPAPASAVDLPAPMPAGQADERHRRTHAREPLDRLSPAGRARR